MRFQNPILFLNGGTDGQAQSNIPLQLFKVGGINTEGVNAGKNNV